MRRIVLILLLVAAAVALVGVAVVQHPGYVLFAYKGFRYESSLWAFLALVAVLALLVWGVRLVLSLIFVSGGVINPWSRRNARRRVRLASEQGCSTWPKAAGPVRCVTCAAPPRRIRSR